MVLGGGGEAEENAVWIIRSNIACHLLFIHLYFVIYFTQFFDCLNFNVIKGGVS